MGERPDASTESSPLGASRVDGANLNVRLDQLRGAVRHLDEANPVVQRLASSPEVAALFSHGRLSSLPESGGFGLGGARARPSFPNKDRTLRPCTSAK
jgi:hypothetical protein